MIATRRLFAAILILIVVVGCSGGDDDSVRGVVIDVRGDITTVESFTLRLSDGTDRVFEPAAGVLFHGTEPIGHIRDHLRNGEPVDVRFRVLDDGTSIALEVSD